MIIVLSSQGSNKDDLVDVRFGRCQFFAVYDSVLKTFKFIENKDKGDKQGPGIEAARTVLSMNADVLLTERLGPKAFILLKTSRLKLYKCHGMSLMDAIVRFEKNALETIEKPYRD